MFIVKIISSSNAIRAISCPHYHVEEKDNGNVIVTTYLDHTTSHGTEHRLSLANESGEYICYVENDRGKTVAVYKAVN